MTLIDRSSPDMTVLPVLEALFCLRRAKGKKLKIYIAMVMKTGHFDIM